MNGAYGSIDPVVVGLSGGKSSAYMADKIIEANPGKADVFFVFMNTGLESARTLMFVRDFSLFRGVRVVWLERGPGGAVVEVDFQSAARDGQPFRTLCDERGFLPNPVMRFCTSELKVKLCAAWAKGVPALADGYRQAIGFRGDEPRRYARSLERFQSGKDGRGAAEPWCPMVRAGATVQDVHRHWAQQTFSLRLASDGKKTFDGNCRLCFMKPASQIVSIIRDDPSAADPYVELEAESRSSNKSGGRFRADRPGYAALREMALANYQLPFAESAEDCYCGAGDDT